jgi:hypothetical protein
MESQSNLTNLNNNDIQYSVAGYHLFMRDIPIGKTSYPPSYQKFIISKEFTFDSNSIMRQLLLDYDPTLRNNSDTASFLFGTEFWSFGLEKDGSYRLESPPQCPHIVFRIQPYFQKGKFAYVAADSDSYPYQAAEIVLFSNWFALYGDVLLHAASIIWKGSGFAFVGTSGAGKSTLVNGLLELPDVEILGEDQAVLRKIGNDYYVFGTPWHVDQERCSPNGAPLRGIFFLNRFNQVDFMKVDPFDAYMRLVSTSFIPLYREREVVDKVHDRLQEVAQDIPVWEYAYHFDTNSLLGMLSTF